MKRHIRSLIVFVCAVLGLGLVPQVSAVAAPITVRMLIDGDLAQSRLVEVGHVRAGLSKYQLLLDARADWCRHELFYRVGSGSWSSKPVSKAGKVAKSCNATKMSFSHSINPTWLGKKVTWRAKSYRPNGSVWDSLTVSSVIGQPANSAAKTVKSTSVGLSWTKVIGAQKYLIYRCDAAGKGCKQIAVVGKAKAGYSASKLKPATGYVFKVAAVVKPAKGKLKKILGDKVKVVTLQTEAVLRAETTNYLSSLLVNETGRSVLYPQGADMTQPAMWSKEEPDPDTGRKRIVEFAASPFVKFEWDRARRVLTFHVWVRFVDDGLWAVGDRTFSQQVALFKKGVESYWSGKSFVGVLSRGKHDFVPNIAFTTKIKWWDDIGRFEESAALNVSADRHSDSDIASGQARARVYIGTGTGVGETGASNVNHWHPCQRQKDSKWYSVNPYGKFWSTPEYNSAFVGALGEAQGIPTYACLPWEHQVLSNSDPKYRTHYGDLKYSQMAAHEFGHMLFLGDAYSLEYKLNNGGILGIDRMRENEETTFIKDGGYYSIMKNQELVSQPTGNDIEMVLYAYNQAVNGSTRYWQYYNNYSSSGGTVCDVGISKVIWNTADKEGPYSTCAPK